MKTPIKTMICVLLLLCLLPVLGFGIYAKSTAYDRQGTADPTKVGDKKLVMITRRDIGQDVIRIRLQREYGYSAEEYEEGDDDSLDYDAYIAAKREVTRSMYTSAANEFIEKAQIERSDIKYIGEYTGTVIAYLTDEKIEELKNNDYVDRIEPFCDNEEQPAMFIVPNQ